MAEKTLPEIKDYQPTGEEYKTRHKVYSRYTEARDEWIFLNRDRFDQYYKNFRDYGEDRLAQLKKTGGDDWMSNIFVPLTASHIRTVHPRVVDSRPDIMVMGRNLQDHNRARLVQGILEYNWEVTKTDSELRKMVHQALVYGTAWGKNIWERKSRVQYQADSTLSSGDPKLKTDSVYIDNPTLRFQDVYDIFPDPYATGVENCRYICQRYVLTKEEIISTWGDARKTDYGFLNLSSWVPGGDTTDYKGVRREVRVNKFASKRRASSGSGGTSGNMTSRPDSGDLYEVVEYWEDDRLVLMVNSVIALNKDNPFPTGEKPFIKIVYEEMPCEMYGVGIAEQVEQVQYAVNTIRNQRIDNVTLNIHRMFILNPLALVDENDLVVRPFGTIRTNDPNAVKAVEFNDVKASAYTEDDVMMVTAKFATGIDDYSRGVGGSASTAATAVVAQKEATNERVKNFVRIIEEDCISPTLRMWIEYFRAFAPTKMIQRVTDTEPTEVINMDIRIQGAGGVDFPVIAKSDIEGKYDFKIGSDSMVAGTQDLKLKRALELLDRVASTGMNPATGEQLVDARKVWEKVLDAYGYTPEDIMSPAQPGKATTPVGMQAPNQPQPLPGIDMMDPTISKLLGQQASPEMSQRQGPLPETGTDLSNSFQ